MDDAFGSRMKMFEGMEADRRLMGLLPAFARLDGKCFHNFTKNMERPYDKRLSDLMCATARYLAEETNACMAYTQSDEITLAWYSDDIKSQIYFDGRISKMISVLAAQCSCYFNQEFINFFYECQKPSTAIFDCRVWNVPTLEEGANVFLWRELDATKNSITMAASSVYSHTELMNKNGKEKQEMLHQKGINFNNYPDFFKRGTYIQRRKVMTSFTTDEIDKLPLKHEARKNPDLKVERSKFFTLDMPPFNKVVNRSGVVFFGMEPILQEEMDKIVAKTQAGILRTIREMD